jgi:hypothetical protein
LGNQSASMPRPRRVWKLGQPSGRRRCPAHRTEGAGARCGRAVADELNEMGAPGLAPRCALTLRVTQHTRTPPVSRSGVNPSAHSLHGVFLHAGGRQPRWRYFSVGAFALARRWFSSLELAAGNVRFRTIADIAGFWPGTVCPLMTQSGHASSIDRLIFNEHL